MKLVSKNTFMATLLVATSISAFAADTVDLKIIGTIVPASCTPTISGGGVADFGKIPSASLNATNGTLEGTKAATLTITCDAPTRVGMTAVDNRAGTAGPSGQAILPNAANSQKLGVGSVSGKTVGAYVVKILKAGVVADGQNIDPIYSQNGGTSWTGASSFNLPWGTFVQPGVRTHSWASTGQSVPGAFSTITQPIEVDLGLNSVADMPALNQEVPIDGLATFSLVYL